MTSKEVVNEYIKTYEDIFRYTHNRKIMKRQVELIKEMELVKKDLEILEILRKNLDLEIIDVCKTYGIYKVHIANLHQELTIDENEFKLVKEWIENGKKGI